MILKYGVISKSTQIFNIKQIEVEKKQYAKSRITLDEIDDYNFLQIYNNFPKDSIIDILDAYKYLQENPQISLINDSVTQKDLDKETKERISNFYKDNIKILNIKNKIYSKP